MESGTRLGACEIIDLLGKGGMGEVYRARDTKLGRQVAIKVLPGEFSKDPERLARLEREARMLAALNHPNIAAIYGLEQSDDTRFLVLELVGGDTLADRLGHGAIPIEESLKLALQIAEALEAAHEKGVIHRDLKPANIKVTPEGRVKVLDFGLAKAFIGDQADVNLSHSPTLSMAATQAGIILGTAAYMSPEQASGEVADHRTDIWSFGVVLFEMLTGRPLFTGKTASHVMGAVLERQPDWSSLPRGLHPVIRELLERCLEKETKNRRQSIADVRFGLQKVLADPGRGVVRKAGPVPRGQGTRWAWVAVLVAGIVSSLATWMLLPTSDGEIHGVVRVPFVLPDGQQLTGLVAQAIDISPDGRMIAYTAGNRIYVKALDEDEPRLVQGVDEVGFGPRISPDGLSIVYLTQGPGGWSLQRIPVSGGAPVPLWEGAQPAAPEWNRDATIFLTHPQGILRIPATGGEPVPVIEAREGEVLASPRLLPTGDILFTSAAAGSNWDAGRIFVQSAGEDDRTLIWEGGGDARYLETGHLVYAQGDALFALRFDPTGREVTGGPTSVIEGIARSSSGGTPTGHYAVSANGTFVQIAPFGAAAISTSVLVYADPSGSTERIDLPTGSYGHARVSPDGTRITFQVTESDGRTEIWVNDRDGRSQPVQLTRGGNNSRPIWSHDSGYVTFMSTRDGTPGIWRQRADLTAEAEPLTTSDGPDHWPDAWSPDGQTLAFTLYGGLTQQSVQTLTLADDAEPVRLTEPETLAGGAAFSPSGEWIAYRALTNPADVASAQIFVRPFPGPGPERQVSLNGGSFPVFSSDGRELFYRRAAPAAGGPVQNELVRIDISTDGRVTYGAERVIPIEGLPARVGIRDYDVIPDEDRLLLMAPAGVADSGPAPDQQIKIILNWFEELKERVPVP